METPELLHREEKWTPFEGRGTLYEDFEKIQKDQESHTGPYVPGKKDTVYLDVDNMKFVSSDEYNRIYRCTN